MATYRQWKAQSSDLMLGVITILFFIAVVWFGAGFYSSFEPASFRVAEKAWFTTVQLAHDEVTWSYTCDGDDCGLTSDTETVIDQEVNLNGRGLDPVVFHEGFVPTGDQYIITSFSSNLVLIHDGVRINVPVSQGVYERAPLGALCHGEIGWFDHVRRLNCGGR